MEVPFPRLIALITVETKAPFIADNIRASYGVKDITRTGTGEVQFRVNQKVDYPNMAFSVSSLVSANQVEASHGGTGNEDTFQVNMTALDGTTPLDGEFTFALYVNLPPTDSLPEVM